MVRADRRFREAYDRRSRRQRRATTPFITFAELPAEEDDAAISQRRKVDQTAFKVLELDPETSTPELDRQFGQHDCICGAFGNSAAACSAASDAFFASSR